MTAQIPLSHHRARPLRLRGRVLAVVLACLGILGAYTLANGAVNGDGTMTVATSTVVANSTGNVVAFTFTNPTTAFANGSLVALGIPTGWTAPTLTASAAGYVSVANGVGTSCIASNALTLSGRTITIKQTCANGNTFVLTYGGQDGTAKVTAPTDASTYTFSARSQNASNGTLTALATSPAISTTLETTVPTVTWECSSTSATTGFGTCPIAATWVANPTLWVRATVDDGSTGSGLAATLPSTDSQSPSGSDLSTASSSCESAAGTALGPKSCVFVWARTTDTTTGGVTYTVTGAADRQGNVTTTSSNLLKLDKSAPTAPTVTCDDVSACSAWSSGASVTLTASGSVDSGGSGFATYAYRVSTDGGGTWSSWLDGASHQITAEGRTIVQFRALDVAGNASSSTATNVQLDRTAPAIAWSCSTTSAIAGFAACSTWYRTTVWVKAAVTDAAAGFTAAIISGGSQSPAGSDATTVTGGCLSASTGSTSCAFVWRRGIDSTSGGVTYAVTATDRAAHTTSGSQTVGRDTIAPLIEWTNPSTGLRLTDTTPQATFTPTWTATDTVSDAVVTTAIRQKADVCDAAIWTTIELGIASGVSVTLDEGWCYRFVATATDSVANAADLTSATVKYPLGGDITPPTGTVSVNDGAEATNGTTVRLAVSAVDSGSAGMYQMRFSNDGISWSAWETYATSKTWTLAAGDGTKTVRAQFSDRNDNLSDVTTDTIVLDTVAPTGTIVVNGGIDYTNGTAVALTLAASDGAGSGVTQMKVRNTVGTPAWVAFATSADWTLAASDGTRVVYVQYQDAAGNVSAEVSDTIVLDRSAPTVTFRCGNMSGSGPTSLITCPASAWLATASLAVQAAIADVGSGFTAAIATVDARTSADLNATYSTCSVAVAGGTACNYVWLRTTDTTSGGVTYTATVTDRAGNRTTVAQTIRRDATAPTGTSILLNSGNAFATSTALSLGLTATDGTGSGLNQMQFSTDNSTWTALEAFAPTKSLTISSGDGVRTVYARFTDLVNSTSVAVTDTIVIDTASPTVTWTCALTAAPVAGDWTACSATWYAAATVWARATIADGATGLAASVALAAARTSEDLDSAASTCDEAVAGTLSCTYVWKRITDTTSGGVSYAVDAVDVAGRAAATSSQRVLRDATAPTGTIEIAAGAAATNIRAVSLALAASDGTGSGVTQMRVATTADFAGAIWKTYATLDAINLAVGGDGIRTVFVQFRDAAQVVSATVSDSILYDTVVPTIAYTCATTPEIPGGADWGSCSLATGWFNAATLWVRATVSDTSGVTSGATATSTDLDPALSTCDEAGGPSCAFVWARTTDTVGQTYQVSATDNATNASTVAQVVKRDTVAPTAASVAINGNATYTPTTSVTLTLSATDATGYSGVAWFMASNDGNSWSEWAPFVDTTTWTLTPGDATKTVQVQFKDAAGNTANTVSDTIVMDATPPVLSTLTVNGGAAYTKLTTVSLAISATDGGGTGVTQMRVSGDGGVTWGGWIAYATTASETLTSGDGVKTVRVEVRDFAGAVGAASVSIVLDQVGPTTAWSCSATSATAADFTTCSTWYKSTVWVKATVTDAETGLASSISSGAGQTPGSGDLLTASSSCSAWTAGMTSCSFVWARTTDTTSGGVTYSVVATDGAANASAASTKNVKRDTIAPVGVSIVVGANAVATPTPTVALTIAAGDGSAGAGSGIATMRLRNELLAWGAPTAYATSIPSWTLSATDGTKSVWVEVTDLAGNVTLASDAILLDTTAPVGTLRISAGADFTSRTAVSLSLAMTDGTGAGLFQMRFMNDASAWTAWESYAPTKAWTLPGEGTWTVRAEVKDTVGNVAALADSITMATGSTITFTCAGGVAPLEIDFATCGLGWNDGLLLTIRAIVTSPFAGLATATASGASQSPAGTDLSTGESTCDNVTAGQTSCAWIWKRTTDTTSGGVVYSVSATDLAGNVSAKANTAVKRDGTPVIATWLCALKNGLNQTPTSNNWGACPSTWYGAGYVWVKATVSDALSGLNSGVVGGYAQAPAGTDLVAASSTCQTWTLGMTSCDFVWKRGLDTTSGGVAFLVTALDVASNPGTASQTVRKDTTAPAAVAWSCATAPAPTTGDYAACPSGSWLGGTTASIRAILTDTGAGFGPSIASAASATDLSAAYSTCDDITTGTAGQTSCAFVWRRSADTAATGVTYTITTPTDAAGVAGASSSQVIRHDGSVPATTWSCSTTSATAGFGACSTSGYLTTIWVRATVTDATAGLAASITTAQSDDGSDLDAGNTTCSTVAAGSISCQVVWARTLDTTSGGVTYSVSAADTAGNRGAASQTVLKGRFGPSVTWTCATEIAATSGDFGACETGWYRTNGLWVKAALADAGAGISSSSTATATDLVAGQSTCTTIAGSATACDFVWRHAGDTLNGSVSYTVSAVDTLGRSNITTATIKVDASAPIAGAISRTPATDATSATSVTVELTGATDAESSIVMTVIHRTSYPLIDGVCGAAASVVDLTVGTQLLATGACYSWSATVTNGAGLSASTVESTPLKVDATPPSAPATPTLDRVGMTSATSVTLTAGAAGTDGDSGVVSTTLYVQSAPFLATACGTYGAPVSVAAGPVALTTSTCYLFSAVSTNAVGLETSSLPSAAVMVDTTAPSAPGTPILGTTATFLGTTTIPVTLAAAGADAESGALTVLHRESAALTLGACGAFDTQELGSDPVVSGRCYRFYAVTTNGAGLTATSSLTDPVRVDTTGPISSTAPILSAGDYTTSTTLTITAWTPGTDPETGVMVTALYRKTAPLIAGVCGTWDLGTVFSTGPGPLTDVVASGSCYSYFVRTINNATVSADSPASTPVRVDSSGPVVTATTTTPTDFTTGSSIAIVAGTASDPESGITSTILMRRVAILSGGACLAYGDPIAVGSSDVGLSGYCYAYFVRVTSGVGSVLDGPASAPVKIDATAPTVAPGAPTTTPTGITSTTSIALTVAAPGADPESGIASHVFYRKSAPLLAGACGTYGAAVAVTGATDTDATPGCRVYYAIAKNGSGLGLAGPDSAAVMIDTSAPSAAAAPSTSPTGSTSLTTVTIVPGAPGTDAESGVASTQLWRTSAILLSGVCQTYGNEVTAATTETVLGGYCYRYYVKTTNRAGLVSSGALSTPVIVSSQTPVVIIDLASSADSGTLGDQLTNAVSLLFDVRFDRAVTDVTAADFTPTGSGCSVASVTGSGTTYAVAITGCAEGSVTLTFAADGAAVGAVRGPVSAASSQTIAIDRTAPTVASFTTPSTSLSDATSIVYTLTFSEPVTGLASSDLALTGSTSTGWTIASVAGSGTAYTVTLTASSPTAGTIALSLAAGSIADVAGTPGPAVAAAAPVVTYAPIFTVTATAGPNGSISPSGSVPVAAGGSQTFTFTPDAGFRVATVTVDGFTVTPSGSSYAVTNVMSARSISVTFTRVTWTVTATAGTGGTISPSGVIGVLNGDATTFTITPAAGWHVLDVIVDSTSVGPQTSYTFASVTANRTIGATFALDAAQTVATTTTVTASAGSVVVGQSVTFTATVSPAAATGTVSFWDGSAALQSCTIVADGTCSVTVTTLTAGTHLVRATFNGNSLYLLSTSGTTTVVVGSSTGSTTTYEYPVVTGQLIDTGIANGPTLSFTSATDGTAVVVFGTTSNPVGTGATPFVIGGGTTFYEISATMLSGGAPAGTSYDICLPGASPARLWHYENGAWVDVTSGYGSNTICGTTSSLSPFAIGATKTTTPVVTLTLGATSITAGSSVTLFASVAPSSATGTITFRAGASLLASCTLTGGTCSASATPVEGTYSIVAEYAGDGALLSGTSSVGSLTVQGVSSGGGGGGGGGFGGGIVAPQPQTLTFAPAVTLAIGAKLTLTATASSALAVAYATTTPAICSVVGNVLTGLAVGSCSISATQAGDMTWSSVTSTKTITVLGSSTGSTITTRAYLGTTLLASNPAKVASGKTVTLRLATSKSYAGRSVAVWRRIGTGGTWTKVTSKTISSTGRAAYSFTVSRSDVAYRFILKTSTTSLKGTAIRIIRK